jgi:hypothetical protein
MLEMETLAASAASANGRTRRRASVIVYRGSRPAIGDAPLRQYLRSIGYDAGRGISVATSVARERAFDELHREVEPRRAEAGNA